MSKKDRHHQPQAFNGPPRRIEIDGANVESVIIAGEAWVAPSDYLLLLAKLEEQQAEIDRLRGASDQRVKQHLRCPQCWGAEGGVAQRRKWRRQINGPVHERCYVCGNCGWNWVVRFETEVQDGIECTTSRTVRATAPTEQQAS